MPSLRHALAASLVLLPLLAACGGEGQQQRVDGVADEALPAPQGGRGGVDLPKEDVDEVKKHLAKYYEKMGDEPPWDR